MPGGQLNGQLQLSIIIVNHLSDALLPDCLRAVASQNVIGTQVIIVNNPPPSNDNASELPSSLEIKRIPTGGRIGFGAACNLGVAHSDGRYLLLLNPDVILEPGAVDAMLAVLKEKADAAIIVGRLIGPDGTFQASCRRFPTVGNLFLSRGSLLYRLFRIGGRLYTLPDYDTVTQVESAAAAMMMIPREIFDRLSGFDEDFFLYMEDTDLCYRAARMDVKIFYVPGAVGRHLWGYSTGHYRFRRIIWHHSAIWKYFAKHRPSIMERLVLGPALFVNCCLSLLFELFTLKK